MKRDDSQLIDWEARLKIRTALNESLIVEAAAGTGKTSELVNRLVGVLGEGLARADQIVAVTFTRKAAGELKIRVRQALDLALDEVQKPGQHDRLEKAISMLEEAHIGTIHSLCAELLRERPVEAQVDPSFEELAEDQSAGLFERAFQPWIQDKLSDLPEGLRRGMTRSMARPGRDQLSPLDQIRQAAWKVLEWRDFRRQWRREPFDREGEIDGLVDELREVAALANASRNWRDGLKKSLAPFTELAAWVERSERVRGRDYDRLEAFLVGLLLNRSGGRFGGTRGLYAPGVTRREMLETRDSLLRKLGEFKTRADADLAACLRTDFSDLNDLYERIKIQSGKLDFVDLLLKARNLVRDVPEIRRHFQRRFTHIFVDEFQDTDPLQAELLLLLAANDSGECDWRNACPEEGKLFLVGDPKQSIYRFRRADVAFYQDVKQRLLSHRVGMVHLRQSFRSVKPIQQLVNVSFEAEMVEDLGVGHPGYVGLEPFRDGITGQPSVIVLPVPRPYGRREVANYAIDRSLPQAVGAWVDWILNQSAWVVADPEHKEKTTAIAPRHIAILFRRFMSWGRDVTRDYAKELEIRGVPHILVGSRSFYLREEVETLRAALTAIDRPDDELSVYAALRGSLFSFPDHLLLQYCSEVGRLHPFRPVDPLLEKHHAPIAEALSELAKLHRHRNSRPISDTINQLLEVTRAHAGFALRPAGPQVLANVQRLVDLARSFEAGGGLSFRAFVEFLEREAEGQNPASSPVLEEGVEGVRMMTVHAAKGLEFPIVILADPTCRLAPSKPARYVSVDDNLAAFSVMGCVPWDLLDHSDEELLRDQAEGVRIAYVAATRARDLLVVPAVGDGPREGWLSSLNRAIYPDKRKWRLSRPMKGVPYCGNASVLLRPSIYDGRSESSVHPGEHRSGIGRHSILWWDPATLDLDRKADFGIRQSTILAPSSGDPEVTGMKEYLEWEKGRTARQLSGCRQELTPLSVTGPGVLRAPPRLGEIRSETLSRDANRPGGNRFGTLVHCTLRDVGLKAAVEEVDRLARFHGRILAADSSETAYAVQAVMATLEHRLLQRAAQSIECRREWPFVLKISKQELVEGIVDLAFREEDGWVIVDFKTDKGFDPNDPRYLHQIGWYRHAFERITGTRTVGWLLGI